MSALKWFLAGCCVSASVLLATPRLVEVPAVVAQPVRSVEGTARLRPELPDFAALIERVGPAVVNVTTRSVLRDAPDIADQHFEIYRGFRGHEPRRTVTGLGSGLVLGDDGYILTNAHVVEGVDEVYVRLTGSKRELQARIVGVDPDTDIALLKVKAHGLRPAPVGDSRSLRVGDWVAAIGSPFGFDNTITAGIISAKERNLPNGSPTRFLQSDVAINPGSSGGPLVNLSGEVVGINSKIYTRSGGYMGVSFAIPIETALEVSEALRKRGNVVRGFLGIEAQPLTEVLAASFDLAAPHGALVTAVRSHSPASRAGIRPGDIVLAYGGETIEEPADLVRAVAATEPGTRAQVELWRHSARLHAAVIVASAPESGETAPAAVVRGPIHRASSLVLTELAPEEGRPFDVACALRVERAQRPHSPASLQAGDIIVAVNDTSFQTRAEFERLVEQRAGMPVALRVLRAGRPQYVALVSEPI